MTRVNRQTVGLSDYPDLVVIHLGMQVYSLRGLRALARLGRQIRTVPGLGAFAPVVPARGPMFSSRSRLRAEPSKAPPVIAEDALP